MKNSRQGKILELIKNNDVENQKQLQELLIAEGFDTTQATVSRDIKELRLMKALSPSGKYRYISDQPPDIRTAKPSAEKLRNLFADAVLSIDCGQNTVCVKCADAMAQAICAAIDSMAEALIEPKCIVGTLAGEDTIFILCRENAAAEMLRRNLTDIFMG